MAMPMYPENFSRKTVPLQLPVYTVRGCRQEANLSPEETVYAH